MPRPEYLCSPTTARFLMRQSVTLVTYLLSKYAETEQVDARQWLITIINHLRLTQSIIQVEQDGAMNSDLSPGIGDFPVGSINGDESSDLAGLAVIASVMKSMNE